MIGIYKITSPSNRIYIGQSVNIKKRWENYKIKNSKKSLRIYNSLIKYGWRNHIYEVIEECDIDKLNERERYWQDFYDVLGPKGLNSKLTETNDKSGYITDKHKKKISKAMKNNSNKKGHRCSDENKLKLSILKKGIPLSDEWKNNIKEGKRLNPINELGREKIRKSHLGLKHSKETKLKMSISNKGKNKGRIVTWGDKLSKALKNKPQSEEHKINRANSKKIKVVKLSLLGELIEIYNSIGEAAESIGIKRGTPISKCCKGKIEQVKNFKFKYYESWKCLCK